MRSTDDLRLEGLAEQELVECAFEFAAAAGDGAGDVVQNLLGEMSSEWSSAWAAARRSFSMPRRIA